MRVIAKVGWFGLGVGLGITVLRMLSACHSQRCSFMKSNRVALQQLHELADILDCDVRMGPMSNPMLWNNVFFEERVGTNVYKAFQVNLGYNQHCTFAQFALLGGSKVRVLAGQGYRRNVVDYDSEDSASYRQVFNDIVTNVQNVRASLLRRGGYDA